MIRGTPPRARAPRGRYSAVLRVTLPQARIGMVLAVPLYHPKRADVVLLKPGVCLDDEIIHKLGELKIHEIWIRYPGLDHLEEYLSPAVIQASAEMAAKVVQALDAVVTRSHARLDYHAYKKAVSSLLQRFTEHPKSALYVMEMGAGSAAQRHAANTCIISVLMGLKLDFYLVRERSRLSATSARDVSNLGVGAMLHDIGMLRLSPNVIHRWNTTQDESDPEFRKHVYAGFELAKDSLDPSATACILHHHQRFDGRGFPKRLTIDDLETPLSGRDIHIFARIVAAADWYDRLRNPPGFEQGDPGSRIPAVRALRQIRDDTSRLDPVVRTALFSVVPPYAPGTMVTLSDGQQAVVTDWSCADPCRPVVSPLHDFAASAKSSRRKQGEPVQIDLRKAPNLSIVTADGQNVAADNFYPTHPHEFDINALSEAFQNRAAELRAAEDLKIDPRAA